MTFDIDVGSLYINQNSVYTENKLIITTPFGVQCVAGETINESNNGNWPTTAQRNAGFYNTYLDTSTLWISTMFACSNSSSSCPAAATTPSSSQGSFTITLDDGAVQFLIDGSTTTNSISYLPEFDQFSVTSQILLADNTEDFETDSTDPRIYLYEVSSPNYNRMWVHSSSRQYIEARPWLLSLLSLTILKPTYIR